MSLPVCHTPEEARAAVETIQASSDWRSLDAFGLGVATVTPEGTVLDTRFLEVNFQANRGFAAVMWGSLGQPEFGTGPFWFGMPEFIQARRVLLGWDGEPALHPNAQALKKLHGLCHKLNEDPKHRHRPVLAVIQNLDDPPRSVPDIYLRLHLLSMRHVRPHGINLDGMFGILPNCVWSNRGLHSQEEFAELQTTAGTWGEPLRVYLQDKIPHLLDYCTPSGVRICNPANVRLGAHLAEGTTFMTAGACNFNAGTLGKCMVEGRISQGVTIGAYTDIGGGASILGTLSGGNKIVVTIGEGCLLEATSGVGIPLGDRVKVDVRTYVKGSIPFYVVDHDGRHRWTDDSLANPFRNQVVKAEALSGISDAIFRVNSQDGRCEVVPRGDRTWDGLNEMLHNN